MDVVINQELLKHLASSDEEVAVTSLATELERVLWRRIRSRSSIRRDGFEVRDDRHLQITLDTLREREKFG